MRLPPFEIVEPGTVKSALSALNQYKGRIKVMAGGTELVGLMKLGLASPPYLLSLKKIKTLSGIKKGKDRIVIGSGTTIRELAESPTLQESCRGISEAALSVAAPPIQNRATIGGNILQNSRCLFYNQSMLFRNGLKPCHKAGGALCHASKGGKQCFSVYQGDMAPALISFGAEAKLKRGGTTRSVPVSDLFTGKGVAPLSIGGDELITEFIIPVPKGLYASSYEKLRVRKSLEYPLISCAAFLSCRGNGTVAEGRLVLGAAGSSPKIIENALGLMKGKRPAEIDVEAVSALAPHSVEALDNLPLPGSYRKKMSLIVAKRALMKAVERLGKEG